MRIASFKYGGDVTLFSNAHDNQNTHHFFEIIMSNPKAKFPDITGYG